MLHSIFLGNVSLENSTVVNNISTLATTTMGTMINVTNETVVATVKPTTPSEEFFYNFVLQVYIHIGS